MWKYNVHRGPNGEMQQAPTAKMDLLANSSLVGGAFLAFFLRVG